MFENELEELGKYDLLRRLLSRGSPQGAVITVGGKEYINFSSNDYLGLAGRPELLRSAEAAGKKFGFGAGASRLLAGGSLPHERLEKAVAAFKMTRAALLFNSGYTANTAAIPALAPSGATIFSDELNHASIVDGCRLSRAKVLVYRHRNVDQLEGLMEKDRAGRKVVVTDSVFSMDGDIAPVPQLVSLCRKHGALLYLDDAHATGVLGGGRGSLAHFGLAPQPWIVQMGTFSKALGSFGAFVAGERGVIDWLANTGRGFMFSTALPAPVAAASLTALSLLTKRPGMLRRLWSNAHKTAEGLKEIGYDGGPDVTPILTIRRNSVRDALSLSAFLWEKKIYAPAIRPPAVREPRIRITVTAAHTTNQIQALIRAMEDYRGGLKGSQNFGMR
jgi:8-amino-7-oxononanoate synthase